jgi:hypothetical protein
MQHLRKSNQPDETESTCFLIWIGVWIVALAVLLPTLG